MADNKPKVYRFASLNKLIKFDNADPECDGMNLSVTVSGVSKLQFQVFNKNTNSGTQFSFYLIEIIPWINSIIVEMDKDVGADVLHREIAGSLPEYAIKPGRPTSGAFVISSDDNGPFVQLTVDNAKLPKWRFKPIAGTMFMEGDAPKKFSENFRMLAWLKMLTGTVTLVSDYIGAISAREWTPPQPDVEVTGGNGDTTIQTPVKETMSKPTIDTESVPAKKDVDQYDDDIPF